MTEKDLYRKDWLEINRMLIRAGIVSLEEDENCSLKIIPRVQLAIDTLKATQEECLKMADELRNYKKKALLVDGLISLLAEKQKSEILKEETGGKMTKKSKNHCDSNCMHLRVTYSNNPQKDTQYNCVKYGTVDQWAILETDQEKYALKLVACIKNTEE